MLRLSQKNQHIALQCDVATIFCNHLAILLQKIIAFQKNQHIASHVATIFCNHLAISYLLFLSLWSFVTTLQAQFVVTNFMEFVKLQVCPKRGELSTADSWNCAIFWSPHCPGRHCENATLFATMMTHSASRIVDHNFGDKKVFISSM